MEEIARTYGDALFEVATASGKLDAIHEQLGEVADAISASRELQVFLFSPYFSSTEKRDGIGRAITGAEPELVNFLALLAEKHRMPAIFRIRDRFEKRWAEARRRLEVTVTSAVELDPQVAADVGAAIERETGQSVELRRDVDPDILGGLVLQVGNVVLDASIRQRLEKVRKEVAQAA